MFPENVKIYIDSIDITQVAFGVSTLTITELNRVWRDIDISSFVTSPGIHTLRVECTGGVGRVEAKIKIT